MNSRTARYFAWIFLAAVLAVAWQFIFPGYYNMIHDDAALTQKYIVQFIGSLKEGIIYPHWMPDNFDGYGSPVFVFYSPLLYYSCALLGLAGLSPALSVTLLKLAGLFTGGLFLFLFAKKHCGERAALLAAVLYILLPARILFLYFINTPAGRFGEAFMPMSLYFMQRYMEGPFRRRFLFGLAMSYAALILSHLATSYMFTPFLAAYGVFALRQNLLKAAPRVALGLGSGILLSSLFFMPVLFERGLVQIDLLHYYYERNLFVFNLSGVTSPFDTLVGRVVITESIMAAAFLYISMRQKRHSPDTWFIAVSAAACLFMMSSLAYQIWQYAPGMRSVAFPYRFVSIYIIFVSVLLGVGLDGLLRAYARVFVFAGLVAAVFLVVLACDALLVARSMPPVSEKDARKIAEENEMFEYLPAAVDQKILHMVSKDDPPLSSPDEFSYSVARWGYADRLFSVDSPRGARIRLKTFYFPGWRAWVDGKETRLSVQDKTGAILVDVPAGRHEVDLKFTDTMPRAVGKVLSLLTLIALMSPYGRVKRLLTHA